jgi:hypothetical protein
VKHGEVNLVTAVYRPEDFGAVPWTDQASPPDAREGIQAAIDRAIEEGGGVIDLGENTWFVTKAPPGAYNHFACLSLHGANVHIRGRGPLQTKIVAFGDAGRQTMNILQFDPGASNVIAEGFTIDTTGLFNTDLGEQTHAIVIGSGVSTPINGTDQMPVKDILVRDVRFLHKGVAGERWGDAIRVAGNTPATAAINIRLVNLDFSLVGRSAIAMQRNVKGLHIGGCYFDGDNIGGTCIDGEATGGGWDEGLVVDSCQMVRRAPGGDNFAIAMTSQTNFAITNNVIIGRGIALVRGTDGIIANNSIDATDVPAQLGVVAIDNLTRDVIFSGNTVRRRGLAGPVVKVQPHSNVFPEGLVFSGNAITNETDGAAFFLISIRDVALSGNKIVCSGGPSSMGIYADAGQQQVENLVVNGNVFRGCAYACVRLVAVAAKLETPTSPPVPARGFVASVIAANVSRVCGPGVRADNGASIPPGGVVVGLNNWSTASTWTPT